MKFYKVTTSDGLSCILSKRENIESEFVLSYKLWEVTWAPKGTVGVMVFDSLEQAKQFNEASGDTQNHIYEVIPMGWVRPLEYGFFLFDGLRAAYNRVWSYLGKFFYSLEEGFGFRELGHPPEGTYGCEGVLVTKRIW